MQSDAPAAPQGAAPLPAEAGDSSKATQVPESEGQAAEQDTSQGNGPSDVAPPQQAGSEQQEGSASAAKGDTAVPGAHRYTINGKRNFAAILQFYTLWLYNA